MRRAAALAVAVVVCTLLAAGAWRVYTAQPDRAGTAGAVRSFDLASLDTSRVKRGDEWRDVRIVPRGASAVSLAPVPRGGVLRLAFTPQSAASEPVHVEVFAGTERIAQTESAVLNTFTTMQVDLSGYNLAPGVRVQFASTTNVLLATCEIAPGTRDKGGSPAAPNVLVFLVDTLRADHLGCYGYERATSPNIDALAADSVRLTRLISQSSWTRPSVASLLTGTYPEIHGAKDRGDIVRQDLATVESALRAHGYDTVGFMSNATCLPIWGIGPDFSRYVDIESYNLAPGKDANLVDAVVAALQEARGRPWFFYAHSIGPHDPYDPPAPYNTKFSTALEDATDEERFKAAIVSQYDGEIAFTDAQFGRLVAELKRLDLYDNTLIVFLSDHGEELWDHGMLGHGNSLYDELIRVPCVVKLPGQAHAGSRYDRVAETIDLAPTVLELCGAARPESFQGRSLLAALGGANGAEITAYSSLFLETAAVEATRNAQSKYIHDIAGGSKVWFDLEADPRELAALAAPPETGAALERYAERRNAAGETGLHILVTGSFAERHTIAGRVTGAALGEPRLRYAAKNGEVKAVDGGFEFRVNTWRGEDSPEDIEAWHDEFAEQNNAHISAPMEPPSPISISVTLDGAPAPASMVFVGKQQENRDRRGAPLDPAAILARPELFDPALLPRRLAVYVWYVPPVDSISDADLDPDMAEAMRALGYL